MKRLLDKLFQGNRASQQQSLQEKYPEYRIGKGTYGDPKIYRWTREENLTIGAYCSIAEGVTILLGGEHRTDWVTTYPFSVLWAGGKSIEGHPKTKGDVVIGNDVWIGAEALIRSGVTIGDGAVIAARAVISQDIPPYAVAAGNPVRILKKRFNDEMIERLLRLKWWQWDEGRIEKALPFLLNTDIGRFIDLAERNEI